MAVKVLSMVWEGYPEGGSELLALLALADWSDDDGRCWPSISAIAKKTRLERRQAQRVIHRLIDSGYVAVTGNETGGAPGSTRQYRIILANLTGVSHDTPTGVAKDTGVLRDTGVTGDADGCHPRRKTGVSHDTQTVSEPSTTTKTRARNRAGNDAAFSAFWSAYPRKVAKQAAAKAWEKLKPNAELLTKIIGAIERQTKLPQWSKNGGAFIPHPATWLNGRRWEDADDGSATTANAAATDYRQDPVFKGAI